MSTALHWFKSTYSGSDGGNCLEVAYTWRKSSYSSEQGGACVEIATCPTAVHVRDSKTPDGPTLALAPTAWASFATYAASHSG
ncbi:DUF397 domain-containing protein [Streptomyces sp. NPDC003016]